MKIRIGDKLVEAEVGENGVPVVKCQCKTIKHPDGRQDVVVSVPCLQIASKPLPVNPHPEMSVAVPALGIVGEAKGVNANDNQS